jgi:O-antigen ligase
MGQRQDNQAARAASSTAQARTNTYWQQTIQNRMLVVVLAMVVAVPLLASPSNLQMQDIAGKALQLMAALLAGILVLRARMETNRAEVLAFLSTGPNAAVLLYLAASELSVVFGLHDPALRRLGVAELQRILAGTLLYFALAYHIRRSEHLVKIRDALTLVTALMAGLGLLFLAVQGASVPVALFGNPQLFSAFLMILFPVPLIQALTEKDARRQQRALLIAIFTGGCLMFTGTSTAWLGVLASLLTLVGVGRLGLPKREESAQKRQRYLLPLLIVLVTGGAFVALSRTSGFGPNGEAPEQTLAYHRRMWYAAEQLFLRKPLFGNGLGTFPVLQHPYSHNGREGEAVKRSRPTLAEMAHNLWLQMAAEQGIVGVGLFLAIIVGFLMAGIRRLRFMERGIRRFLLLACVAGIVGFAIDALGNPAWQFAQVSMFFWLILGLGMACLRPRSPRADTG